MEIDLVEKKQNKTSASSLKNDHLVHACLFMSESYQNNFLLTILIFFFHLFIGYPRSPLLHVGYSQVAVHRLLITAAFLVVEHGL